MRRRLHQIFSVARTRTQLPRAVEGERRTLAEREREPRPRPLAAREAASRVKLDRVSLPPRRRQIERRTRRAAPDATARSKHVSSLRVQAQHKPLTHIRTTRHHAYTSDPHSRCLAHTAHGRSSACYSPSRDDRSYSRIAVWRAHAAGGGCPSFSTPRSRSCPPRHQYDLVACRARRCPRPRSRPPPRATADALAAAPSGARGSSCLST